MKKLQIKEIKKIFDANVHHFSLEPTDQHYETYTVVISKSSGLKIGVLETFRGSLREFNSVGTAVKLIKREFPAVKEIKVSTTRKLRGNYDSNIKTSLVAGKRRKST